MKRRSLCFFLSMFCSSNAHTTSTSLEDGEQDTRENQLNGGVVSILPASSYAPERDQDKYFYLKWDETRKRAILINWSLWPTLGIPDNETAPQTILFDRSFRVTLGKDFSCDTGFNLIFFKVEKEDVRIPSCQEISEDFKRFIGRGL